MLVAVIPPSASATKEHALDELEGLVQTAGVTVVGKMVQVRSRPHPATFMGKGKLDELRELLSSTGADLIVSDNNLSPAQARNLEQETDTILVDRSEVILDIFATRAQTYEAKLQVELAQLLYFRPRLKRLWNHLERIEGGIGTGRGPGEKQIETDRRLLDKRVAELKKKLGEIEKRRERTVAHRNDEMMVSLVGYTNAGKSTLMHAVTGADVYIADKLFATLDTRTRKWPVPNLGDVLLSDTVGFVRDLPHHLVASFKSTLEEARHADLLLHVVDATHPEAGKQIETVNDVLTEIGVDHDNTLLVFNKTDAIEDHSILDVLRGQFSTSVSVSSTRGTGLDRLAAIVAERLGQGYVRAKIETHVANGRLMAYLCEHADVTDREYNDSQVTITCRMAKRLLPRLNPDSRTVVTILDDERPAENGDSFPMVLDQPLCDGAD